MRIRGAARFRAGVAAVVDSGGDMGKVVARTAVIGLLAISGLAAVSGPANAASYAEYCVASGGEVVVRYNRENGNQYYLCRGGKLDGWILGQPLAR